VHDKKVDLFEARRSGGASGVPVAFGGAIAQETIVLFGQGRGVHEGSENVTRISGKAGTKSRQTSQSISIWLWRPI